MKHIRFLQSRHAFAFQVTFACPCQRGFSEEPKLDKKIRMNMAGCPFTTGMVVYGALTPWRGEWYWSGTQKTFEDVPEQEEAKMHKEMLERSSSIAYRYCPPEAAKALEFTRENLAKFVAHYGGDLVVFPDGLALAAAEQKRMEAHWRASDPDAVARVMRERGLEHPRPRMSFPPKFLKHDKGIGAFSNPDRGLGVFAPVQPSAVRVAQKGRRLNRR